MQDGLGVFCIFLSDLNTHAANGIGIHPVHLDQVFVLDVSGNPTGFEPQFEQVGLFRFAETGNRYHSDALPYQWRSEDANPMHSRISRAETQRRREANKKTDK